MAPRYAATGRVFTRPSDSCRVDARVADGTRCRECPGSCAQPQRGEGQHRHAPASLLAPLAGDIAIVAAIDTRPGRLDASGTDLAAGRMKPAVANRLAFANYGSQRML